MADAGDSCPVLPNGPDAASRPNQLWVCDFTYPATWSGFAYTAFITDVHSRMIVGSRTAASMTADSVTDALEMAIFSRRRQLVRGVIVHSDTGSQYTSIAHTELLGEIGALASISSIGDSYGIALAQFVNGRYKTSLIRGQGPWRHAEHVELETLAWVDWFNNRQLRSGSATSHPRVRSAVLRSNPEPTASPNTHPDLMQKRPFQASDADTTTASPSHQPDPPTRQTHTAATTDAPPDASPEPDRHIRDRRPLIHDLEHSLTTKLHNTQLHQHDGTLSEPTMTTNITIEKGSTPAVENKRG